jgi:putative FmdB family regulatory protein
LSGPSSAGNRDPAEGLKEEAMPTYEFVCEQCKKSFSLLLKLSEYEKKKYSCPKCKSKKVKQQLTPFQTKTAKKS